MKQTAGNACSAGVFGILVAASLLGGCEGDTTEEATPQVAAAPAPGPAELVLHGGAIYTVDAARSWAEALAVRDGRLVYVGGSRGVQELVGPQTQVIDLGGRMVLPGMQDVHIHAISGGMDALTCDLNGKHTAEEYVETVKGCAEAQPNEPWIVGSGWLASAFGQGVMPSRLLLDAVVPNRPVYLTSTDGHTAWVNSKALEVSGITRETLDPEGGRIDRSEQGELIGSLQERAGDLVFRHVPAHGLDKRVTALRNAVEMLNRYGITAIQDASFDPRNNASELETYAALDASGGLNVRAVVAQRWDRDRGNEQIDEFEHRRAQYTRGRLRATTVKIMQDGVLENFTGVLSEPYLVEGSPLGIPMLEPQRLNQAVTELDAKGFQVHFHAIGDGAVRQCLDAVAAARAHHGVSGLRHHIAHLQLVNPVDVPRFRLLDVIANFQPLWAFADRYVAELNAPVLGPERMRWMYPIGSVHASGAMIAFGSDWSVSTANPYEQIEVAVRRADPAAADGEVFLPDERLPLPEAIAAFTINAAYVNGLERETGSLEVGKAADLVVLDRNLFAIDPREISETKALLTLLEGKPVHGDPGRL